MTSMAEQAASVARTASMGPGPPLDDSSNEIRPPEPSSLKPADLKGLLGMSRKFSIPFLEWLDAKRITIRKGDVRIWA